MSPPDAAREAWPTDDDLKEMVSWLHLAATHALLRYDLTIRESDRFLREQDTGAATNRVMEALDAD